MTPPSSSSRSESLSRSWKERHAFTDGLAGTPFHNSWRAVVFTVKGKRIGCCERWRQFRNFKQDMWPSYEPGRRLSRKDKSKPFDAENCEWVLPGDLRPSIVRSITYNGKTQSLKEWCLEYDLSLHGVILRYYKSDTYTPHEMLFGKTKKPRRSFQDQSDLDGRQIRLKASKMISAYKCKDKKRRFPPYEGLTIEWLIDQILKKPCTYCRSERFVGADRIDNSKGHCPTNVVPCCIRCNTVRNSHFTYEQMLKVGEFLRTQID